MLFFVFLIFSLFIFFEILEYLIAFYLKPLIGSESHGIVCHSSIFYVILIEKTPLQLFISLVQVTVSGSHYWT